MNRSLYECRESRFQYDLCQYLHIIQLRNTNESLIYNKQIRQDLVDLFYLYDKFQNSQINFKSNLI